MARAAQSTIGCYVIIDMDDDDMGSTDLADLAGIADQLVASCPDVAAEIQEVTGHTAIIIPDCDEDEDRRSFASLHC